MSHSNRSKISKCLEGSAFDSLGKYMEVISAYDSELKNNPQYEIAWNNKGSALNNLFSSKKDLLPLDSF